MTMMRKDSKLKQKSTGFSSGTISVNGHKNDSNAGKEKDSKYLNEKNHSSAVLHLHVMYMYSTVSLVF